MTTSRLLCTVLTVGAALTPSVFGQANAFFDDSAVQTIQLTVNPADWATLRQNYLDSTYYHATFNWNGIQQDIGIRSHGSGSRSPVKPNLDLNFAKYSKNQTFLGMNFVVAKANNEDASNLREWISMKLYRKMGIPSPREAPAQLFVNGELRGFYFLVEHLDEPFLQRNFGESTGYLYEWESAGDSYDLTNLGADPSLYAAYLDLKTDQAAPDLQTFANFIQAINQAGAGASYLQGVAPYLDPKQFLTYVATEQVLAGSDGMVGGIIGVNNFYFYQPQGTTRYYFIPWDKDFAFSDNSVNILSGISQGSNINPLAQNLVAIPEYSQIYLNAVTKAATLLGGAGDWADSEISREYTVIHDAAVNDPNKQCMTLGMLHACGAQDFENDVDWLHAFLQVRADFVKSQAIADGYVPSTGGPQISQAATVDGVPQLSPGALANVDGTALAISGQAAALPLPRVLGNAYVSVEGVRAPLASSAEGNVEIQMPLDIPVGTASLVVWNDAGISNTLDVVVKASTPSIVGVTHADGSLVSAGNPIVAGESIAAFATGLGAIKDSLPIGSAAPSDPLATTLADPQISAGDLGLEIVFSGLAPGYIGLYQVNAQVPASLPPDIPYTGFTLTVNGESSSWQ